MSVGLTLLTVTVNVLLADAAIVVDDGDGHGVDAVVGVGVLTVERPAVSTPGPPSTSIVAVPVLDRRAVAPVDRVGERLGRLRRGYSTGCRSPDR